GPKFVLAHILLPHHPYLFDSAGNIRRHATLLNQFEFEKNLWQDKKSYVEQLMFVNRQIESIVVHILSASAKPPIIILQSDHGPEERAAGSCLARQIRFANLTALHLPGWTEPLPHDISAVNIFRFILNTYFKTELDILPNRHFFSDLDDPFGFQEIQLEQSCLTGLAIDKAASVY
ncbi:MAG TPA: hypothetical protein PLP17_03555, partial [Oligoflexia bacterium]|nr:hypothetical protein [Oligoflexia bacterium]